MSPNFSLEKAFLAVKTGSKAISELLLRHGKSPCFLEVGFLHLLGVDAVVHNLLVVNGEKFLECAFCHGSR